jgi:hypothetical protein
MKHCMSMQMTYIICTNIYLHMVTVHIWFKSSAQVHMKLCMSRQMTYIICTNIYLHHLHKYIWNIGCLFRWLITSALTYTYTWWLCISGLSHLHKNIWIIVCPCRCLTSSALTYTYTWWLCIWFKSSAQVHIKHCMFMQMTYIICTNIYLHMLTVHMV